jgi:hypothetical protein
MSKDYKKLSPEGTVIVAKVRLPNFKEGASFE